MEPHNDDVCDPTAWECFMNPPERLIFNGYEDDSFSVWEEEFKNSMELKGLGAVFQDDCQEKADPEWVFAYLTFCLSEDLLGERRIFLQKYMDHELLKCLKDLRRMFCKENKHSRSPNPPTRSWCSLCKSRTNHKNYPCITSENEHADMSCGDSNNADMSCGDLNNTDMSCDNLNAIGVEDLVSSDIMQFHHQKSGILSMGNDIFCELLEPRNIDVANFTKPVSLDVLGDTSANLIIKDDSEILLSDTDHENSVELVSKYLKVPVISINETEKPHYGVISEQLYRKTLPPSTLYIVDGNTHESPLKSNSCDLNIHKLGNVSSENLVMAICDSGISEHKSVDELCFQQKMIVENLGAPYFEDENLSTAMLMNENEDTGLNQVKNCDWNDNSDLKEELNASNPIDGPQNPTDGATVHILIQPGAKLSAGNYPFSDVKVAKSCGECNENKSRIISLDYYLRIIEGRNKKSIKQWRLFCRHRKGRIKAPYEGHVMLEVR